VICQKRKFFSKKEAKKFMRVENLKYRDESPLTMVYECLDCHHWHVTHKDKCQARDKKHNNRMHESQALPELEILRRRVKANQSKH
jgi:hypothetical protein